MTSDQPGNLWRASHRAVGDAPALRGDIATDLLVIGAGFTGCSAALEGAQTGAGVVVLEAGSIGHGGSGRNVGLVNAGLWLPPDRIIGTLGQAAGMRLIDALSAAPDAVFGIIAAQGIDCGAVRNGTLHLAHAPSGLRELEDRFRQGNRAGAPLQLLDAGETARRTGSDAFYGALFDPRGGTIQPLAYCRGLAQAARSAGAQIFENAGVSRVWHDGTDWHAASQGHSIRARHLIVATNAYADGIRGVPGQQFVPVHFSQFATAPLSEAQRAHILPGGEGCWDTDLVMSSVRLDGDGRLVIGGCGNLAGPGARLHRRWAARKMATLYPALAGLPFTHAWEGKIAMTADHLPKVVAFGPGAVSIFGYSGRGIGPGTLFGKCAAQALLYGKTDALPIDPIAQHREGLKGARTAFYEIGATATHAIRPSPI
ncbi:NAD(P)/FAD-dependent oxidoreductase [Roseicitreum antarcticum]|uniref:Glycine/D-amino acid oxidase n=1 Tax=Roseicitreum antarcticum TaxID=564137 RepID=A0A1H2VDR6_9RHOB|nr:FAD-binding oxidoreductase [Roseicitreum antarcticum]SDW66468.1 Glycine/D-amino acid oxidase [Roseicitreum antarcticum]